MGMIKSTILDRVLWGPTTSPVMPEETVRVLVRCRPFNKREEDLNCGNVIEMDQEVREPRLLR